MKVICKHCGKKIEQDDVFIHAAQVHGDMKAAQIQAKLDLINAVLDDGKPPIKVSDIIPSS